MYIDPIRSFCVKIATQKEFYYFFFNQSVI